jgi:hypothetical protein
MIVQMDNIGRKKPVAIQPGAPITVSTATDGTGSRGDAEATRALHHTRDERVGNRISE